MIPFGRDEILSRLAEIPAVLWTLHKLHPVITRKKFDPGKARSFFCTAGTKFSYVVVSARVIREKK